MRRTEKRVSIYVVEDEPKLAALLADYLQAAGYTPRCIDNGESALAILRDEPCPALVLLDIMLPGIDGMAVCRALRQFSTVPVIMITARVEEIDRLLGLELGADDYICKPFSPREVVARVQALLRRGQWLVSNAVDGSGENSDAELVLDRDTMSGRVGSRALELTPIEFRLLEVLTDRRGRVFFPRPTAGSSL